MKNFIIMRPFHDFIIGHIVIKYDGFCINKPYVPNYFSSFFFSDNKDLVQLQINQFSTLLLDKYTIPHIIPESFIDSCKELYNLLCLSGETFSFSPAPIRINNRKYHLTFTWKLENDIYRVVEINSSVFIPNN